MMKDHNKTMNLPLGIDLSPMYDASVFREFVRKPSKWSMGKVIVCCKCRCTGVQLMRYGNKYICVDCIRKGKV